jgi:hypothetical protein
MAEVETVIEGSATWTCEVSPVGPLWYVRLNDAAPPSYLSQKRAIAILDIAEDGTLAGIELIDNAPMPPPPATPMQNLHDAPIEVKRYRLDLNRPLLSTSRDGDWVRYEDHASALLAERARAEELDRECQASMQTIAADRARAEKAEAENAAWAAAAAYGDGSPSYTPERLEGLIKRLIERAEKAERERDEAVDRAEELEHYQEKVSADFEGDCWRAFRVLLNECHFDWRYVEPEGVTAEMALEHIRETLRSLENDTKRVKAREARLREALDDCIGRFVAAFPAAENYEPIKRARAALSETSP